ncbi:PIR Superfamily Protein [Plasmodium ovale wallikeri]|uniref:PIR Superfamily Protein n=1 Tax=Plasmodium ovale wallikeri TaxID=864142 RepID=A0A1A9AQS1_PLAOA|nr:PIR Superfamily Protein [Plasmodium ovale wallikeri]
MAKKIDEESLPPYIFYEILNKKDDLESYKKDVHNYTSIVITGKDTLRDIGAQLMRNYKVNLPTYRNMNFEKRCRDLNYWVHKEISNYKSENNIKGMFSDVDTFITEVWDKLQGDVSPPCKRDENNFPIDLMDIRKELDDFCTNRDMFIMSSSKCQCSCTDLNEWINEKYDKYFSEENCPTYKKSWEAYTKSDGLFHISEYCSFYDISKTFPTFRCNGIPYYRKRIKSITNCENSTISNNRESTQYYRDTSHSQPETPILVLWVHSWIRDSNSYLIEVSR